MKERIRREHLDCMVQLKGIARNLNRLTKLANTGGFASVVLSHGFLVSEIEDILKRLRHDR